MHANDPLAVAVVQAIQTGDVLALERLLAEHPGLETAVIDDDRANLLEARITTRDSVNRNGP